MNRRQAMTGGLAALAVGSPRVVQAATEQLGANTWRSYIERPHLVIQNCPQWCWAASASMIFAHHGYAVAQERIVSRVFGGMPCVPSGAGPWGASGTISAVLGIPWQDDLGRGQFRPTIVAGYDHFQRVNQISNAFIVEEVANNRPLLYCNTHHAMVIVSVVYQRSAYGVSVEEVGVLDPWPTSGGYRTLNRMEMTSRELRGHMTYLAAVHI